MLTCTIRKDTIVAPSPTTKARGKMCTESFKSKAYLVQRHTAPDFEVFRSQLCIHGVCTHLTNFNCLANQLCWREEDEEETVDEATDNGDYD